MLTDPFTAVVPDTVAPAVGALIATDVGVLVAAGLSVSAELALVLLYAAVSVTVVVDVTAAAVAVKLAAVLPAATVTELGVVTDELLSEIVTVAPPVGAAPDSVTVQVDVPAPVMAAGVQLNEDNVTVTAAGDKVRVTVPDTVL